MCRHQVLNFNGFEKQNCAGILDLFTCLMVAVILLPLGVALPEEPNHGCRQFGRSNSRNNVVVAMRPPIVDWDVASGRNIKWVADLGSKTFGSPVIADGRVFVGTNNGGARLDRFPSGMDLGCVLCFAEETGEFLWQYSSQKLRASSGKDWPEIGISSTPIIEGNRLWFVNNRCEVICLDAEGFADGENDGTVDELSVSLNEADLVWKQDIRQELGVSPRFTSNCSPLIVGDLLFLNTSEGRSKKDQRPAAPSFVALRKTTGEVMWSDATPSPRILNGQWSSPAAAEITGVRQVFFAGGDGWMYAFDIDRVKKGASSHLWQFDCNSKSSRFLLSREGKRNNILATPVVYEDKVYIATGREPAHGEGFGCLWCIDPSKRGDTSPELLSASNANDKDSELPSPNPESAVVWSYQGFDSNEDGKIDFAESMHRTIATIAIHNDLVIASDMSGFVHCLDAKNGAFLWSHQVDSPVWASPLIVNGTAYIATEDGRVIVFDLARGDDASHPVAEIDMGEDIYSTPVMSGGVLYIATLKKLVAIEMNQE